MIFLDPLFPLFFVVTVLLAHAREQGLGVHGALAMDAAFLLIFLGPLQSAVLIGFALAGFAMLRTAERSWRGALAIAVVTMVALFVVLKKYSFLPAVLRPEHLPVAVGLSYVLFRLLHLIIDRGQGGEQRPGLAGYLHYTLSCHALASGPFQPYEEHTQELRTAQRHEPLPQLTRFATGLLKVVLVAPIFRQLHDAVVPQAALAGHAGLAASALVMAGAMIWLLFMYFNFSGYMDIVIGWARLCRFNLPENFDQPLKATGFLDFWGRWHMTMTQWFKTYVFNQLMMVLGRRISSPALAAYSSSAAFFVTFLLVGAWHGPNPPFLLCGLFLAIGATVNQLTRDWLRKRRRKLDPDGVLGLLGAGLGFTWIAVAVSPFWLDGKQYQAFLHLLLSPRGAIAFIAVCLITALLLRPARWLADAVAAVAARGATPLGSTPAIALRLVIVVLILLTASDIPDFVYQGI